MADAAFFASADGRGHDADDGIVHNSATGELFHERDGTGKAKAVLFAKVDGGLSLGAADFLSV